jgi:hypothetical protein
MLDGDGGVRFASAAAVAMFEGGGAELVEGRPSPAALAAWLGERARSGSLAHLAGAAAGQRRPRRRPPRRSRPGAAVAGARGAWVDPAQVNVKPGAKGKVKMKPNALGKSLLRKGKQLKITLKLAVSEGGQSVSDSVPVTIKAAKHGH